MISQEKRLETETEQHTKEGWGVCVECLMGKQNKPTLFKVTEPSSVLARTLQATSAGTDLLYLCDSETTLDKVSRWIGRGPRATLAGDANADIMKTIIECLRARALRRARTFMR